MKDGADFSNVTHYTKVDVQPGGINIQNVENLYQADILKLLGIELQVKQKADELPEVSTLVACVDSVREFFWGDSSLAVIFCTCRDCYGYADNMSQFERDFHCQEGLLSNTFRNNPYMRLHVDKWAENGAKQRVLQLMDAYKNAVEVRQKCKTDR